jgi:hypothetical protein
MNDNDKVLACLSFPQLQTTVDFIFFSYLAYM